MKHLIYKVALALSLVFLPLAAMAQSRQVKEIYTIQKKDNLYRVALTHGISVEELVEANPEIDPGAKLKKGKTLRIPYTKEELAQMAAAAEKTAREKAEAERKAFLSVPHPVKKVRAAAILPFKDGDQRASRMLEFYSGMLVAVDSVKSEGTDVEISAYHSGTTLDDINKILADERLAKMDLIVGPLEEVQAQPLVDYCAARGIRLVMPFATTGTVGIDKPTTYVVTDEQEDVQTRAARLSVKQFGHANYIFVGCANSDERGRQYVSSLVKSLEGNASTSHQLTLDATDAEWQAAIVGNRRNIVVMNSIRESNLQKLIATLDRFTKAHGEAHISMLGYPDWLTFKAETQRGMFRYDAHVYSTFFRNAALKATQSVEAHYKKKFGKPMAASTPRFGLIGFDLGYYFLHGIAAQGASFEYLQSTLNFNYLQHRFDFQRAQEEGGFINRQVFLVCYKPTRQIVLKDK